MLRAHLASGAPAQVCVALEKASVPDLIETLVTHATRPSADVRRFALARLAALRPAALRDLRAGICR